MAHSNIIFAALLSTQLAAQTLPDYNLLDHTIMIESVRGGNHDEEGSNQYYFTGELIAYGNTREDLAKDIAERRSFSWHKEEFGALEVPVLSHWAADEKNSITYDIKGNDIRKMIAKAMRKFEVKEDEVAIQVAIKLYERDKIFGFFGDDRFVAEKVYFPVPPSAYLTAARTNLLLKMKDELGAHVTLKVRYDNPIEIKRQEDEDERLKKRIVPDSEKAPEQAAKEEPAAG